MNYAVSLDGDEVPVFHFSFFLLCSALEYLVSFSPDMGVETLNVSWDNFPNVAKQMFHRLRSDTAFTDVTLVSEDLVHVRAHRVILAASSDIFQAILSKTSSPGSSSHPLLYLRGVHHSQLESLLTFVYEGEVEVEEKKLEGLMRAAMELKVKGLFEEGEGGCSQNGKKGVKPGKSTIKTAQGEVKSILCEKEKDSKNALIDLIKRITSEKKPKEDLVENAAKEPNEDPLKILKKKSEKEVKEKQVVDQKLEKVEENLVDLTTIEDAVRDRSGNYPCPHCDFKTKDLARLRNHYTTHEDVKFTCMWEGCDQKYANINGRKRHEKKMHGDIDDFGCDKCDSMFTLPEDLKKHIVDAHSRKRSQGK